MNSKDNSNHIISVSSTSTSITNPFDMSQQDLLDPATPNQAKSIRSIPMIPTSGESSPTTVLFDITADRSVGISELKRILGYSRELFLPEAMVYGNDLIKVWNIDDEQMVGEASQSNMIYLEQDPTYNKFSTIPSRPESQKERTRDASTIISNQVSTLDDQMDDSSVVEMDDLLLGLSSNSTNLSPRLSPARFSPPSTISLPPHLFSPPSPLHPPQSVRKSIGSTKTIVLESIDTSLDQEISEPPATTTRTKPPRGHRRGHIRSQSHFDFQFH